MPWVTARSRTSESTYSRRRGRGTCVGSRTICPASTLDRSRMSLSSSRRCRPEVQMSRRYSSWRSLRSPNMRSRSTSEKPITALSGVRSSCDMFARNSDLWRLATSELAEEAGVDDGQRRLAGEGLEQLAHVLPEGTASSAAGSPGRRRARPDGSAARRAVNASRPRAGPRGARPARPRRGRRSPGDADLRRPGRPRCLRARSSACAGGRAGQRLLPKAARTTKVSATSSYSMIEPPSVSVSRTALATMRSSTSSRSRLELTASPSSRRASSWATLLASSSLRASSTRIRSTCRSTMAACAAKLVRSWYACLSKASTSVRVIRSTPTTSSSRSIGAAISVR